ncbi:DUF1232 domain-containing protein [Mammaliicoccus sciuri]|uniref:Uncharacterized membrane protein YkvA, DUF1232 family n=1 Tax=Sporosarcina newyorkensis TaxID=759851 RepID=A0A1T4XPJ2_9BACL|nr:MULTISPECIES: DUF1232 domain-containing protein [Sporosarcina]MBY0222486.1 DUF1232 domain-containing protein [Sporosarcina aquimarina]SKA91018.1 Uncharacterized membrane protein YkvA, DUF1232 family [Sporosarcina newyorkensis]
MSNEFETLSIGHLLRNTLKKHSLSMRKLSERTDIDTATISRIINNKRKATLDHLEKFSSVLDIPLSKLLEAAGYSIENKKESTFADDKTIQHLLDISDQLSATISISNVEKQLAEYKDDSQTTEGKNRILNDFEEKLQSTGGTGPFMDQLKYLFGRFKAQNGSKREIAIIGSALLYFIAPIDAIPDYLFAIGYIDDAIAVQIASSTVNKN